jgi:hypothetical protein
VAQKPTNLTACVTVIYYELTGVPLHIHDKALSAAYSTPTALLLMKPTILFNAYAVCAE